MTRRAETPEPVDDDAWRTFPYDVFVERYVECLPPCEYKLRSAVDDYDAAGIRPVPFRRIAELLAVALWRWCGPRAAYDRGAARKAKLGRDLRRFDPEPARASPTELEAAGLDAGLLRPHPPRAARLRLGRDGIGVLKADCACWDGHRARLRWRVATAIAKLQARGRGAAPRRRLAAARAISRAGAKFAPVAHARQRARRLRDCSAGLVRAAIGVRRWRLYLAKKRVSTMMSRYWRGARARKRCAKRRAKVLKLRVAAKAFLARFKAVEAYEPYAEAVARRRDRVKKTLAATERVVAARACQRRFRGNRARRRKDGLIAARALAWWRELRLRCPREANNPATAAAKRFRGAVARRRYADARRAALLCQTRRRGAAALNDLSKRRAAAVVLQRARRADFGARSPRPRGVPRRLGNRRQKTTPA